MKNAMLASFIFLFIIGSDVVYAETVRHLSLGEAVGIGLAASKTLKIDTEKQNQARARVDEAKAYRLPSVKLSAAYARLSDLPDATLTIPIPSPVPMAPVVLAPSISNSYNLKLAVTQPLFTGFRITEGINLAKIGLASTASDDTADRNDVVLAITNAYWMLVKSMTIERLVTENIAQIEEHLRDAKSLVGQGMLTASDLLKVELRLGNVKLAHHDSASIVKMATVALASLLGLPLDTRILPSSETIGRQASIVSASELIDQAFSLRPELTTFNSKIRMLESTSRTIKSDLYPQVALTAGYTFARPNQRIFPTKDQFDGTWEIGFGVSYDFWNIVGVDHRLGQTRAQIVQSRIARDQVKDAVALEVTQTKIAVDQAWERIEFTRKAVGEATESYRIVKERFRLGVALSADLLDAETELLSAKANHETAMIDYEIARAKLTRAVGK